MQMLTLTNELREVRGALRKEVQNSAEANKRAEKAELELKELKVQLEKKTGAEESQMEVCFNIALVSVSQCRCYSVLKKASYVLNIYLYLNSVLSFQMEIAEACRRSSEQASMAEAARLENVKLLEENMVISCLVTSKNPPVLSVFVCTVWVCIDSFLSHSVCQKLKEDIERLQRMCEFSSGANVSNNQQQQIPLSPVPASPINTQQQPQLDTHLYEEISGTFGGFLFWKKKIKSRHADKILFISIR